MLRVATVIATPHWGGLQVVVERTTEAIRAAGYERVVILPLRAPFVRERLEAVGATVVGLELQRPRKTLDPRRHVSYVTGFLRDFVRLKTSFRRLEIAIVEVSGLLNLQAAMAAKSARLPLVWQMHSTAAPRPIRIVLGALASRLADVVMTSGVGMASRHGGLRPDVVPFCSPVDARRFRADPGVRRRVRAAWGFADDHIVVGTLGNRGWQKRHELLVDAASRLRDVPSLRVALVGEVLDSNEAYYNRSVRDRILRLRLSERVHVIDQAWPAHEVMNGFDIFALPSVAEGASLVTAEAMATSLPIVATDVGSVSDVVRPGRNGFLVSSADDMAEAIRRLESDPALRKTLGAESRAIIQSEVSAERCAAAHLEAYRRASRVR